MGLRPFEKECPGLAGSVRRLYGADVAQQLGCDYEVAATSGGNDELGVAREDGVSFNPRIARIVASVIQDCPPLDVRMLRVAMYSAIPAAKGVSQSVPEALSEEVRSVHEATEKSESWIQGIALALMLDRVRHMHMTGLGADDRKTYLMLVEESELLGPSSTAPQAIRIKVSHAVNLQKKRLEVDRES